LKARYIINPSEREVYSIFTAETLAIVSKEITENLEAQTKPFTKDLVVAEKAPIKT
jgi:hypothetical protein